MVDIDEVVHRVRRFSQRLKPENMEYLAEQLEELAEEIREEARKKGEVKPVYNEDVLRGD